MTSFEVSHVKGRRLEEILPPEDRGALCATVDNNLKELDYLFGDDDTHVIVPLDITEREGNKVYENSLRYLVGMAVDRGLPELKVKISYGVSKSMYLTFFNRETGAHVTATAAVRDTLERVMREIVAADYHITRSKISVKEAEKLYASIGAQDRIKILPYRPEDTAHIYTADGYIDYPYGFMVSHTGLIDRFRILSMNPGLILSYPRPEDGGEIPALDSDVAFARALKRNREWAQNAGLASIADVNLTLEKYGATDLVGMCEAYCSDQYEKLGEMFRSRSRDCRLIFISGPSSSGKTTFAKRLRTYLMSFGLRPLRISMDDYYLSRDQIPAGPDGEKDLEALTALDLARFNADMASLSKGLPTEVPTFDFQKNRRSGGRLLTPEEGSPIIVEGIHALNPQITDTLPREVWLGIYISPQVQVCIDDHNPMSLTDVRLIRRIVRDNRTRNTSPEETIVSWGSVRKGEFENIYPFEDNADFVFNSYLSYEMCAMKKHALPALNMVQPGSPAYVTAQRLIKFIKYFSDIPDEEVPCNSLLREFIGGSVYE